MLISRRIQTDKSEKRMSRINHVKSYNIILTMSIFAFKNKKKFILNEGKCLNTLHIYTQLLYYSKTNDLMVRIRRKYY